MLLSVLAATRASAAQAPCRIALDGNAFDVRGLPALSARGTLIAVAVSEPDGDRGLPNLKVVFFPLDGRPPATTVVLTLAEIEEAGDAKLGPALIEKIEPRLDLVNAQLSVAGFAPLKALDPTRMDGGGPQLVVTDGTLELRGRTVDTERVALPECADASAPQLSGVWALPGDGRDLVVRVDFGGCGEPRPVWRVLHGRGAAVAPPPAPPAPVPAPAISAPASAKHASLLNTRAMRKFHAKDWAAAAADFRAAIAAFPDHVKAHYNLACLASLTKDRATALAELRWLAARDLPEADAKIEKARTDPDLAFVRDDPEVRAILGRHGAASASR